MLLYLKELYKMQQTQQQQYRSASLKNNLDKSLTSPKTSKRKRSHKATDVNDLRNEIIQALLATAEHFGQQQKTTHYAICYLDLLLRDPEVASQVLSDSGARSAKNKMDRWLLVSTSMLLASKFMEPDDNLIMIAALQKYMKPHRRIGYLEMTSNEITALDLLDWNLFRVLPLDYVQIFL